MNTHPELEVITRTYDLIAWFLPTLSKMPKPYRFSAGARVENLLFETLDNLLEAKYSRDKQAPLRRANLCIEKLRFTARLCSDLRLITLKQYEFAARQLDAMGKSAGAWLACAARGREKADEPRVAGRVVEQQRQQPARVQP